MTTLTQQGLSLEIHDMIPKISDITGGIMPRIIKSILDFDKSEIEEIFKLADLGPTLFSKYNDIGRGKIAATLFFQPSTRTSLSFKSAFIRLGGNCIGFSNIEESRSGSSHLESMADTARVISHYCDVIVMRTPNAKDLDEFADYVSVPLISAGHGSVEHPTSAMNNIYTMQKYLGRRDGIHILIITQFPKRTIHSFLFGVSLWKDVIVDIITPPGGRLYPDIENKVRIGLSGLNYFDSFKDYLDRGNPSTVDAIMIEESLKDFYPETVYDRLGYFNLNKETLGYFRKGTFVSHPLPRIRMISPEIDDVPGVQYFEMTGNGPFIRAAVYLLTALC